MPPICRHRLLRNLPAGKLASECARRAICLMIIGVKFQSFKWVIVLADALEMPPGKQGSSSSRKFFFVD